MTRPARNRNRHRRTRVITLPQLLSTAVEADPDAVAVVVADADATLAELTYAELDERSTRLARLLIDRGIGPEDLVAIAVPRSLEAVIALWAVAKCGAGFVPVDPDDSPHRIAHIVIDAGAVLGLTVAAVRDVLPAAANWLTIDTAEFAVELEEFAADPVTYADRLRPLRAEHPAFVVYTVDEIGALHGITVRQAGLSALCDEQRIRYRVDGDSRTLAFATPSDSVSVLELLLAVSGTATMIVTAPTVRSDAELAGLLLREDVTHAYLPADMLESVDPAGLDELRVLICVGRYPGADLVRRWTVRISTGPLGSAERQVLVGYGGAETTIVTHIGAATSAAVRTIGISIQGITEYVLDERLSPVPDGEVGELYLAGAQLARGYHRRPAQTAARFVANPHVTGEAAIDLSRLFRTGDMVRRSVAGSIEYVGTDVPEEPAVGAVPNVDGAGRDSGEGAQIARQAAPEGRHRSPDEHVTPARDPAPRIPLAPMPRPSTTVDFADITLPGVPLSPAQQPMWALNRANPESVAETVCFAIRLGGRMRIEALQVAVVDVIERHETLRTVYPAVDGIGYQVVLPLDHVLADLTPESLAESEIQDWLADFAEFTFDVTAEIPVRIAIAELAPDDHVVAVVAHRIAADEGSVTPFLRDLAVSMLARRNRARPAWAPLPVQYADYALWQHTVLGDEADPNSVAAREIGYWREVLAGTGDGAALPADRPRPDVGSGRGAGYSFTVDAGVRARLGEIADAADTTLFTVVHAVFAALLARLSSGADVVVGTPAPGRGSRELDGAIGLFANLVALRTRVDPAATFTDLLERAKRADRDALAHAEVPFDRLAEALGRDRSWLRVALVIQETGRSLLLPGLSAAAVELDSAGAVFDLRLALSSVADGDEPGGLSGTFTYATDLFDEITIAGFAERLLRLLTEVTADPQRPIGDIDLLRPDERIRILHDWNNTHNAVAPGLLLDGYRAAVHDYPQSIAVSFEDTELTYAQFDARVNQLARLLISRGVGPETLVGLVIRPSLDLLIGMYAIVSAGGAYVPVDPDHSAPWTEHILDVTRPVCMVSAVADSIPVPVDTQVLRLDTMDLGRFDPSPVRPEELAGPLRPDNPAYVLFSPGAAGRPRGVVVSHAAISHQLEWMSAAYPLGRGDVYLHRAPATIDASLWGCFLPLRVGATVRLATVEGRSDPLYLAETIAMRGVTVTDFVPSQLAAFAERTAPGICPTLREVFVTGEPLPAQTVAALRRISAARVHNLYGAAEVAVSVTYWPAVGTDGSNVPIGLPQWNTRVYVLDERLRPVPVGVPGELYLAGAQLARGYAGLPLTTAARFVADPFSGDEDGRGGRMYRTGDLVVWRDSAGELPARLDYLGRANPGRAADSADETVSPVAVHGGSAGSSGEPDRVEPLAPSPELPSRPRPRWVPQRNRQESQRESEPGETSGTVSTERVQPEWLAPDTEKQIRNEASSGAEQHPQELTSPARPADPQGLEVRQVLADEPATGWSEPRARLLSPEQERMWLLNRADSVAGEQHTPACHLALTLRLIGSLDVESLGAALDDVIARHEVLRTIYPGTAGDDADSPRPARTVLPARPLPPLTAQRAAAHEVQDAVRELAAALFELGTEAPLRVRLFEIADLAPGSRREYVLAVVVHRIAADSASLSPFAGDLMTAYAARTAGREPQWTPLPAQYADYVRWQEDLLGSADSPESPAAQQIAYWRRQLAGLPELVELPLDRRRPAVASLAGARVGFHIVASTHAGLLALAQVSGATLFTVVHTAVAAYLGRITAAADIAVGTTVPGRGSGEFADLIGTFVNTVVLRTHLILSESFTDLLVRQRQTEENALAHADIPFVTLVDALGAQWPASHHPLFQVGVSVRTAPDLTADLPGLTVADTDIDLEVSRLDLDLTVSDTYAADGTASGIHGHITYATDLFDAATAESLAAGLTELLAAVAADPAIPLGSLGIDGGSAAEQDTSAGHPGESEASPTPVHDYSVGWKLIARPQSDDPAESEAAVLPRSVHGDSGDWQVGARSGPDDGHTGAEAPTLASVLDDVASADPDAVAIIADLPEYDGAATEFVLGDLDARANRLARYLISLGAGPESLVAVAMRRSADLGVAIYAVAKAGGAVVAVDPQRSVDHNREIIAAADPVCVLTDADYLFVESARTTGDSSPDAPTQLLTPIGRPAVHRPKGQPVTVRVDKLDLEGVPTHRLTDAERTAPLRADHPAWVIFPSPSTRVVIPHAGAVDQLHGKVNEFGLDAARRMLLRSVPASETSLWEFWAALSGTPVSLPAEPARPRTLPELMAAAVAANPTGPAVVFRGRSFTYNQLDQASSKLARRLIALGAGPEKPVAVAIPRSLEALVTVWSVAKTGAAVMPVEPFQAGERIADLVSDSGAALGVTVRAVVSRLPRVGNDWIVLDDPAFAAQVDAQVGGPIADAERITGLRPDDGAYVLYGPGDVDHGQGAVVGHGDLADLAMQAEHYRLRHDSRILALASPSSDEAVLELLLALGTAAALVVVPATVEGGPELSRLIQTEGVTHAFAPAAVLRSVDREALAGLEVIITDTAEVEEPEEGSTPTPAPAAQISADSPAPERSMTPAERIIAEARESGADLPDFNGATMLSTWQPTPDHAALSTSLEGDTGTSGEPSTDTGESDSAFAESTGGARSFAQQSIPDNDAHDRVAPPSRIDSTRSADGTDRGPAVADESASSSTEFAGGARSSASLPRSAGRSAWAEDRQDSVERHRDARSTNSVGPAGIEDASTLSSARHSSAVGYPGDRPASLDVQRAEYAADGLTGPGATERETAESASNTGAVEPSASPLPVRRPSAGSRRDDAVPSAGLGDDARRAYLAADRRGEIASMTAESAGGADRQTGASRDSRYLRPVPDARAADSMEQTGSPESAVRGVAAQGVSPLPLPPRAIRLLENSPSGREYRAIALGVPADCPAERAGTAVQTVLDRHPLLSAWLAVVAGDPGRAPGSAAALHGWTPAFAGAARDARLVLPDTVPEAALRTFAPAEGGADAAVRALSATLDPAYGRNIAFGLVMAAESAEPQASSATLVAVANGLVVDDASWRIIIGELLDTWSDGQAAPAGAPAAPAPVARAMAARATDDSILGEMPWWRRTLAGLTARTPFDGVDLTARGRVSLVITAEGAAAVAVVAANYHTGVEDVLLAALALALVPRTDAADAIGTVVQLPADGRVVAGPESAGAVGGFTTAYPLVLTLDGVDVADALAGGPAAGAVITQVKERRRAVPSGGTGYGLLRYLNPSTAAELAELAHGRTAFRYRDLRPARGYPDTPVADLFLDITVDATGEGLLARFDYASAVLDAEEVRELAGHWVRALGGLAEHGTRSEAGGFTPSDFPLTPLAQADVDRLLREYSGLTDLWPLMPAQADLLANGTTGAAQFAADLRGALDDRRMRLVAQAVLDRHTGLRVALAEAGGDRVQVVVDSIDLSWRTVDFSDLDPATAAVERDRYQNNEPVTPFDTSCAPLLRLALLRTARDAHRVLITAHPLLLDDRSLRLLMRDLLIVYTRGPRSPKLPAVYPYRPYPDWLAAQDRHVANAFWNAALSGYHKPVLLAAAHMRENTAVTAHIDVDPTAAGIAGLRKLGVTMQTVVQAAWGLLLGRTAGRADVVFGLAVPGRPAEVPNSETLIGRFGGIVPVRVRPDATESARALVLRLQSEQARWSGRWPDMRNIRESLGVEQLFDSVIVFRDAAADLAELTGIINILQVSQVLSAPASGYPVTVAVTLGDPLHIELHYPSGAVSESMANYLVAGLSALIRQIVDAPETFVSDLDERAESAPTNIPASR